MSPVKDNVGRGLNIALVNGELLVWPQTAPGVGWGAVIIQPTLAHRSVRRGGLAGLWEQKA